ncbi:MAG: type II toxin-antitoxin system YafQ family toxin [Bacteroidales bacterium]|nr:type II toxin-antitoxin system YafQ family toxin [Bacteroidales bacterium]
MKYKITVTNKYLKDLKLARKRGLDETRLNSIVEMLATDIPLDKQYRDHNLKGNYTGFRECHINADWLLIYYKDKDIRIISLERTGTHSDLFK